MMKKIIGILAIYPIYLIVLYGTPPAILTLELFNLHHVRECVVTSERHRRFLSNHQDLWGPIHIGMLLVKRRNHSRKL
jgi:hypothetical protein